MHLPVPAISRAWVAARSAAVERMGDREVRWRALGTLFGAGGLLTLLTLVMPTEPGLERWAVAALAIAALFSALVMIGASRRLPGDDLWVSLSLGFGTLLITGAIVFARAPAAAYSLMYVWVGFDGFFFLSRRSACRHLVFVGACYAAALSALPVANTAPQTRWIMTMGTVGVVGALAGVLRERSDRLISKLGESARTDALTGVLNRRGFEELMASELESASATGQPVSLVVGDLDHFKVINDRFGHREGDGALRIFSELLRSGTHPTHMAARIGGEEFAIILPATEEYEAFAIAERLRRRVRSELVVEGHTLCISFGVATGPQHGETVDKLLHSADQALYTAKRLGRDRSVMYSAEVAADARRPDIGRRAAEQLPSVLVLAETLDLRDTGTAMHSQTVGRYAEATATHLRLEASHVERIRLAGLLHDIGKIGVADPILRKAGPLTDAEWAEMRKHPELGARILAAANLDDISGWVLAHHERPDGTGYPAGLTAREIPLEAQILAVADSFEAMTSDRVYRKAMPIKDAADELRLHAGTQFDPDIVNAFLVAVRRPPEGLEQAVKLATG